MTERIIKKVVEIRLIEEKCQKCNKLLKARSKSQMKYNMDQHLKAHEREENKQ